MLSDRIYWVEHISSTEPIMEFDRKGFMGWLDENYEGNYLDKLEEIDYDLDIEAMVTVGNYGITCSKDDLTGVDRIDMVLDYFRDKLTTLPSAKYIFECSDELMQDEFIELQDMIHNLELIKLNWWE